MLHPIVIATTLPLGVNNGAKIGLVLAIIMAGLGQLWLGRELGTSSIARI